MKPIRILLPTLVLALGSSLAAADSEPLAIGQTVPERDVKMRSVSGKEVSISDQAGKKGTLVVFMCNHCPWVKMWQTRIAAIGNEATSRGVGVIAVNANDPSAYPEDGFDNMKSRAKQLGFKF